MTAPWNFERRRVTCARFLIGTSLVTEGKADSTTSLEAVRSRLRMPPEDALFAARRLNEEGLLTFDPGGQVRSHPEGIKRAEQMLQTARLQAAQFDDATRIVGEGGMPLEILKLAVMANGGSMVCASPSSGEASSYRLVSVGDGIAIERMNATGVFEAVT